ncbi:thiolase-like protein, partial [Talaromyces proteolyticus]
GSIKPNIRHLEAAAGAIGLIKAVMAVDKGIIPPQARLNKLNTSVNWKESGIQIVREKTEWNQLDGPRRAAVCSYGYGGTVSHAVIEQTPVPFTTDTIQDSGETLLVLSAPHEKRLAKQCTTQAEWISTAGRSENLKTIAAILSLRRAQHDFRAAFVVSRHSEAAYALSSFAEGAPGAWAVQGRTLENGISREAVWVFSGHGAQWTDMGKKLLNNPIFRKTIAPLDSIVFRELGFFAIASLGSGVSQNSDEIQVLTYLMQVGLSQVLKFWGV